MLAGEAVVAIWNGLAPGAHAAFHDWHIHEHIPERVGIPGFRRGRRYVAADAATHPEFFTLYEADTLQVLQGADYARRLDAPTPATTAVTAQFRDTFRALARVLSSHGPGSGGTLLTLRLDAAPEAMAALAALAAAAERAPRVTGAHLCQADAAASGVRSAESRGRADIGAPPALFVLIEATDAAALAPLLPDAALAAAGARLPVLRGLYRLEYSRSKTAWGTG